MPVVRLALAQMNAVVGDLATNLATIARLRTQAQGAGADLVVTPEMALTGYPPEDLLLKEGFVEAADAALDVLVAESQGPPIVVGTVLAEGSRGVVLAPSGDGRDQVGDEGRRAHVANALAVVDGAEVVTTATKRHLPNYDVFDERRYFHPGVGPHALVRVGDVPVGLLICEDVWLPAGPARELADQGARLLVVANASPYARGRREERREMLRARARETGCAIAYVNLVGGQDELVFDGQSMVVDATGELIASASAFDEVLLVVDVEVPAGPGGLSVGRPVERPAGLARPPLAPVLDEVEEVYRALVTGTRDYLRKNGFRRAILGLSGGVDSSLVATIAVDAVGARAVRGVAMPSRYSSTHSLEDAAELARRLDIELSVVPIEPAHATLRAMLAPVLGEEPTGLTDENLQSRVRGVLLMGISNSTGAIVLTTGNKSEMATGYSTLYGDSAGGFAVIKDVPKTLVYQLCHYRNAAAILDGDEPPIPVSVLEKPPSAELRPDQRDDQSLPPYDELDPLLELYVERDATAVEMIELGHDPDVVQRIVRLVDGSEYKRRQMPPGVRISGKAFGRDRRMPITNGFGRPR